MSAHKIDMLENAQQILGRYEKTNLSNNAIIHLEEGFSILYEVLTEVKYTKDSKRKAKNIAEKYVDLLVTDIENNYVHGNDILKGIELLDYCDELNSIIGISDKFKTLKDKIIYHKDNNTYVNINQLIKSLSELPVESMNNFLNLLFTDESEKRYFINAVNKLNKNTSAEVKTDKDKSTNSLAGKPWIVKNISIPEGTEFRTSHLNKTFYGKVLNGALVIDGRRFNSPSSAGKSITGYDVNGWTFWSYKKPNDTRWFSMDSMRK